MTSESEGSNIGMYSAWLTFRNVVERPDGCMYIHML